MRRISTFALLALVLFAAVAASSGATSSTLRPEDAETRTQDGSNNNQRHTYWGQAGKNYIRVGAANFADGVSRMVSGPAPRFISNRVFNDRGQNIFSENGVSQWGWAWGQFIDHDFGLRDETAGENADMAFNPNDPLETFRNDFGVLAFSRTPAAPRSGTSTRNPRQEVNTITSYIDGSNVYGSSNTRLDWLRDGLNDGNPFNNRATLLLTSNGYLPRVTARGNAATAPPVDLMGALAGTPTKAVVAGDVRANENIALTSIHTLFAREHNRIVGLLPSFLSQQQKFQLARRVVGAEIQFVTYNEFLPSLGVRLNRYAGYNSSVNSTLGNEFAAAGYRAHSMIHGEFEPTVAANRYSNTQLTNFQKQGIIVENNGDGTITLVIPLVTAFGNPDLLEQIGEKEVLQSLGAEPQYNNDEQIDNSLRSVLFQVPKPGATDPTQCGSPVINENCFVGAEDLGADDIQRGRDHGIPYYNDLRAAYGLPRVDSFTDITGESTSRFPSDPKINPNNPLNDPNILDFVQLRDEDGNIIPVDNQGDRLAVTAVRRTTLAARLRAIYGDVNKVDGFVGLVAEKHVVGSDLGPLQLAIFKKQFEDLRDGDRFFYGNDSVLSDIASIYHISYRHTLAEIIRANTGLVTAANVFIAAG